MSKRLTLKRDFNLTRLFLKMRPDAELYAANEDSTTFTLRKTGSGILGGTLDREDAEKMMKTKKVVVIYEDINEIEYYNFTNDSEIFGWVMNN